jgi:hypothetical protein
MQQMKSYIGGLVETRLAEEPSTPVSGSLCISPAAFRKANLRACDLSSYPTTATGELGLVSKAGCTLPSNRSLTNSNTASELGMVFVCGTVPGSVVFDILTYEAVLQSDGINNVLEMENQQNICCCMPPGRGHQTLIAGILELRAGVSNKEARATRRGKQDS